MMRVLLLTHSFNSLSQRLFVELTEAGHEVSVELDINADVTAEAVRLFEPQLIVAPYLKRRIPEAVWRRQRCIVLHPGIRGDRGPSALDWAILDGERRWGVTALQANADLDAGDTWAEVELRMRPARKSSLYRDEVTEAAVQALRLVLERAEDPDFSPQPLDPDDPELRGRLRPKMLQRDRKIDWSADDTDTVLRKIRASDGDPGVRDTLLGQEVYLFNAVAESELSGASPGEVLATRSGAICRATVDGAVWITHLRRRSRSTDPSERGFKLPAALLLRQEHLAGVPEVALAGWERVHRATLQDIAYWESGDVGQLSFDFYNGAMGTAQCRRLLAALRYALARDTRVLVLWGGPDFWSNGLDLNLIEHAERPGDASWDNINAINDLAREIICAEDKLTVAALRGNAGAGGVFLALAADRIWARSGVVLNPHYKAMGNLHGSEYWTYLLPRRVGDARALALTEERLPVGAAAAARQGLIDAAIGRSAPAFELEVLRRAISLASDSALPRLLADKRRRRAADEAHKPLSAYRDEELEQMKLNFYGFDSSYHVARYNFVHRVPHSRTPLHLAKHRGRSKVIK
jgi:putative two-component system protein, hydrogenase maturation factor HypX/HoxX